MKELVPAHPDDESLPNLTEEVAAKASERERIEAARQKAREAIEELPKPAPRREGSKVFISPEYLNGKFLVKQGATRKERLADGRLIETRDDDLIARFRNGLLTTDDPDIIEWAKAHPEICRDADDPDTPAWVALKTATLATSRQDPSLPPEMDIAKLLRGEIQELVGGGPAGDLLRAAQKARR